MSVMGWSSTAMAARCQHVTASMRRGVAGQVGGRSGSRQRRAANGPVERWGTTGRSRLPPRLQPQRQRPGCPGGRPGRFRCSQRRRMRDSNPRGREPNTRAKSAPPRSAPIGHGRSSAGDLGAAQAERPWTLANETETETAVGARAERSLEAARHRRWTNYPLQPSRSREGFSVVEDTPTRPGLPHHRLDLASSRRRRSRPQDPSSRRSVADLGGRLAPAGGTSSRFHPNPGLSPPRRFDKTRAFLHIPLTSDGYWSIVCWNL
jgi:hypothetical protein